MPRVGVSMSIIGEDGQTTIMAAAREDHVPPTSSDYKVSIAAGLMRLDELVGEAVESMHAQAAALDIVDPRSG